MNLLKFLKKHWFLLVLIGISLTPIIWFWGRGGVLINGLDTNFPLDPVVWLKRRFFAWYDVSNAGSDFSSSISGLFFHLIQVAPYLLGLSLQHVEIFSLVFWFGVICISSFFFARSLTFKNKVAEFLFVLVYSFNIYLFNTWENVKVSNLALYASFPLFLSLINFFTKGEIDGRRLAIFSFLGAIVASGAGINPAYFLTLVLGIFIYSLINWVADPLKRKAFSYAFCLTVGVLTLTNLFWILPLLNNLFIQSKIASLADIGLTDWLDSLSENTSLLNVIRLQGAWDWYSKDTSGAPLYLPYVVNYFYKLPFILFSFALPSLMLTSLILRKSKTQIGIYLSLGIFFLVGVFMGAGTHQPTGSIFRFLAQKIPYFSFFRSPWYIFTPFLILSYAGFAGLSYLQIEKLRLIPKRLLSFGVLLFAVSYLLYSYPLVSGKIFRPSRPDGFYINFPDYVWETKNWLKDEGKEIKGRIITYPDDQIENFSWGYRGTDTILALFSTKEFITPSFNLSSSAFINLLSEFYSSLKKQNYESAFSLMKFFGADTIFNRRDFSSLSPKINEGNSGFAAAVTKTEFGEWSLLKVKGNTDVSKVYVPKELYLNYASDDANTFLAKVFGKEDVLSVKLPDTEFSKAESRGGKTLTLLEAVNKTSKEDPTNNHQRFLLDVPKDGTYNFFLEKRSSQFKNTELAGSIIILDGNLHFEGGDSYNPEYYHLGPTYLTKGIHTAEVTLPIARNMVNIDDAVLYSSYENLRNEELPLNRQKTIVVFNSQVAEDKITVPVRDFDPFRRYVLKFDYKYFYGRVPIIDIVQSSPVTPVKTFPDYVGSSFDWVAKSVTINPVPVESKLEVFIKMPPNERGDRSKTFIENLSLLPIYDNRLFAVGAGAVENMKLSPPAVSFSKKSPVKYEVKVSGGENGYYLVFLENYSNGWRLKSKDIKGVPIHFTANGFANGWYIPGGKEDQRLVIFYSPQNYFNLGAFVFLILLGGAAILAFKKNGR